MVPALGLPGLPCARNTGHAVRRVLRLMVVAALAALLPAADPDTDLRQFQAAVLHAPAVAAARARIAGARLAQGAADVLPDPMIGADIGRAWMPVGDPTTMYGAMIEQPLPRWGEREAQRQTARARTDLETANAAAVIGDHAAAVATGIAEWMAARDTLVLIRQSQQRLAALHAVVRSRVAVGNALIDELLTLDSRAQLLDLQLADQERRQADALSLVRGRLGLPPDAPIPPFAAPDPATLQVEGNPMARTAAAMHQEALAMESEALARGNPETAVGLTWEREAARTEDQSDKVALTFRMSLPIHRSAYADAASAARAKALAARHEAGSASWMVRSRLESAQRAIAQARLARRTADDIAERTRTAYEALIRQVGSGGASATTALGLLDMITESGREAIQARLAGDSALAELWRLAPPDLATAADTDDPIDHHPPEAPTP